MVLYCSVEGLKQDRNCGLNEREIGLLMGCLLVLLLVQFVRSQLSTLPSTSLVTALVGGRVKLPCAIPKLEVHDRVRLILWYREDIGTPIYSVDARDANFSMALHWSDERLFGRRASFKVNNVSSALIINGIRKEDEGYFRCRMDFLHAQTRNSFLQLQVIVPPRKVWITDSHNNALSSVLEGLTEGTELNLTCHSEGGDPDPQLSWLQDNQPLLTGRQAVTQNGRALSLHISSLDRSDSGTHLSCHAFNSNLAQPLSATVKIGLSLKPLDVKIDDTTKHLSAGTEATLTCRAYGARPPPVFTWWKDGVIKQELGLETANQNETVSSIRFTPQLADRGRLIKCSVRQRNETVRDPVEQVSVEHQLETTRLLLIHYKPLVELRLGASLKVGQIKEGDDIYFDCLIDSVPVVHKVIWFHNGNRLFHNVSLGRIISNHSLVLQKVDRKMSGLYACSATNTEGEQMSNNLTLDVQYSPICKPGTERVYGVARHEQVNVLCEADANPADITGFRWAFNGTSNGKMIEIPSSNFSSANRQSTLRYIPTTDVEFGTVLCWARNSVGEQEVPCIFHIVTAEKPDPVRNCTLSHQSTDSLYFQCLEGFSGGLEQYFSLEVLAADGTVLKTNVSSTKPAFSVRGLSPDAMFYVIVTAVNAKGRSEPVTTKVFTLRPPETQKNTEANSKTSKQGDFWTDNSPLIGAVTGAVLCLLLMTAPIVVAFLHKSRTRRASQQQRLDTISGATSVEVDKEDKPDVVPRKGQSSSGLLADQATSFSAQRPLLASNQFYVPDSIPRHQRMAVPLSEDPWATHFSSTLPRKKPEPQQGFVSAKSYLNILLVTDQDYQKHESQV